MSKKNIVSIVLIGLGVFCVIFGISRIAEIGKYEEDETADKPIVLEWNPNWDDYPEWLQNSDPDELSYTFGVSDDKMGSVRIERVGEVLKNKYPSMENPVITIKSVTNDSPWDDYVTSYYSVDDGSGKPFTVEVIASEFEQKVATFADDRAYVLYKDDYNKLLAGYTDGVEDKEELIPANGCTLEVADTYTGYCNGTAIDDPSFADEFFEKTVVNVTIDTDKYSDDVKDDEISQENYAWHFLDGVEEQCGYSIQNFDIKFTGKGKEDRHMLLQKDITYDSLVDVTNP